jgi:hypothetical protein
MSASKVAISAFLLLTILGCSTMRASVSALPIDENLISSDQLDSNNNLGYVGKVILDSEKKCTEFMAQLMASENTSNTLLDMSNTVFSALATAFTPVSTIHALTAGATISSGWKTAINTDVYAKAAIATYAQAMQASYYKDLRTYVSNLPSDPNSKIIASLEVSKIQSIHQECSLASAQMTVSATIRDAAGLPPPEEKPSAIPPSKGTVQTLDIKGPFSAGDTVVLTAVSKQIKGSPIIIKATIMNTDTTLVAKQLADMINKNTALKTANVSADIATVGKNAEIALYSSSGTAVTWTPAPTEKFNLSAPVTKTDQATKTMIQIPGVSLIPK